MPLSLSNDDFCACVLTVTDFGNSGVVRLKEDGRWKMEDGR